MVLSSVWKPLGLVLLITAHMIVNGRGHEQVTGLLGGSVTLRFTFNVSITNDSQFGLYVTETKTKISDNKNCRRCFDIYPENSSVLYHIANLTSNDSEVYHASLLSAFKVVQSNNKVQLILREETRNTTVSQTPTNSTMAEERGSSTFFSCHFVIVLGVLLAALLTTALTIFICCVDKTKGKTQQEQQTSNTTLQVTVEESNLPPPPPPSLVYSVLDFPKRSPVVAKKDSCDTDYAIVIPLPEAR
ncbi:unnamed protein product [Ophioblennius macclurei]